MCPVQAVLAFKHRVMQLVSLLQVLGMSVPRSTQARRFERVRVADSDVVSRATQIMTMTELQVEFEIDSVR